MRCPWLLPAAEVPLTPSTSWKLFQQPKSWSRCSRPAPGHASGLRTAAFALSPQLPGLLVAGPVSVAPSGKTKINNDVFIKQEWGVWGGEKSIIIFKLCSTRWAAEPADGMQLPALQIRALKLTFAKHGRVKGRTFRSASALHQGSTSL